MSLTVYTSTRPKMSTGTNIIICTTTTTGVFKYRFHCRIEYYVDGETASKVSTFVQPKNSNGVGVFNLSEIYKSVVTPMIRTHSLENYKDTQTPADVTPIHNLPIGKGDDQYLFSRPFLNDSSGFLTFQGQCNRIDLTFSEMYATTSGGIPTIQGTPVEEVNYVFYGRGERNDEPLKNYLSDFRLTSIVKKMLTNNYKKVGGDYIGYIGRNQRMTMTFANGHDANESDTKYVRFTYYDSTDTQISYLRCTNEDISGGKYGGATGASNDQRSLFLIIGAGFKNLNEVDTTQTSYSGLTPDAAEAATGDTIVYYTIHVENTSQTRISAKYKFILTTPCDRYEETRLAYMNRYGCWEYINLNKERKDTLKVKRDTITKPIVNTDIPLNTTLEAIVTNTYAKDMPNQGVIPVNIQVEEELSLFTQNLDDSELSRIQELIMSPQIHMCVNDADGENTDSWVALICKTNKIDIRQKGVSKLYNYELKFSFADPKYRTL